MGLLVRRAIPTTAVAAVAVAAAVWADAQPWMPQRAPGASAASLLEALAGFAGVFLGFYYAALGLVVEQVYATGSRALRQLVRTGRAEEAYVWFVVLLGVTSLLLLAVDAVGVTTGIASVGLVTVAGVAALVGASRLLTSGLRYFDPGELASDAKAEVLRQYALVNDRRGGDAVAAGARGRALPFIDVFGELARTGDVRVADEALGLLLAYWSTKPVRTSASGWWQPAMVRPDWFASDGVEMALQAGGQLHADTEHDRLWVERPLAGSVAAVLGRLVAGGAWLDAYHLLDSVATVVRQGALGLLVEETALLVDAVTDALLTHWPEGAADAGRRPGVGEAHPSDLWDAHGRCVLQLVIGSRLGWTAFVHGLEGALANVSGASPSAAERLRVPLRRKERLRDLAERLEFEAAVEGATPTPRWFWLDYVSPGLLWELVDHAERVEAVVDRLQGDVRPALRQDPLASASAARRTLEVRRAWELFRDEARAADEALRAMVKSADYDLPESPLERMARLDVRERLEDTEWVRGDAQALLDRLGDAAAEELLGHAYTRLCEWCVRSLTRRDPARFATLFQDVFRLSVVLEGRVPFGTREWLQRSRVSLGVQPLLDLMAISGLALVRDEVSGPRYWESVRVLWDQLFDRFEGPRDRMTRLLIVADGAVLMFGMTSRLTTRTRWGIEMWQALEQEGVARDDDGYNDGCDDDLPSRPILDLAVGPYGLDDPVQLFAAVYLAARPEAAGADLGYRITSLLKSLDRRR